NVMYDIPSRGDVTKCVVSRDTVVKHEQPLIVTVDRKKKKEGAV
ncbi:MAG: ATP-dependent Clp protease ATP-binding subunit ClpX, partial [Bacillota bacterium]